MADDYGVYGKAIELVHKYNRSGLPRVDGILHAVKHGRARVIGLKWGKKLYERSDSPVLNWRSVNPPDPSELQKLVTSVVVFDYIKPLNIILPNPKLTQLGVRLKYKIETDTHSPDKHTRYSVVLLDGWYTYLPHMYANGVRKIVSKMGIKAWNGGPEIPKWVNVTAEELDLLYIRLMLGGIRSDIVRQDLEDYVKAREP